MSELANRIQSVSRDYGLPLNPDDIVADLPVGIRQRIEIVRCLLQEPQLIIMDEPTSVLTPQEADLLFLTLERLAKEAAPFCTSAIGWKRSNASVTTRRSFGMARWFANVTQPRKHRHLWPA